MGGRLAVIWQVKELVWEALRFAASLAAAWVAGRRSQAKDTKIVELQGYADKRKRMDEVGRFSDADAARDWLRDRDQ